MHKFKLVLFLLFTSSLAFGQSMSASKFEQDYRNVVASLRSATSREQGTAVLERYFGQLIDQIPLIKDETSDLYWRVISMSTKVASITQEPCNTIVGSLKFNDPDDRKAEIKDRDKGVLLANIYCKLR